MENTFRPVNMMGVALLHKCNFSCAHCGYIYLGDSEDHIVKPGYRLTWDQINTLISDCKSIKDAKWTMLFTGGEPTLWEEGALTFMDILLAVAKAGIAPSFNTNGSYFHDPEQCSNFFNTYSDNADVPLNTFISIDKFHDNYDRDKGRALSLDNVVKVLEEMPAEKKALHQINVVTIVTKDPESSLPEEMVKYYSARGIMLGRGFPMLPIGKAKNLADQLPPRPDFMPPPPQRGERPQGALLVGDSYMRGNREVAKLGHLVDLFQDSPVNA